jgi:hypothetical protein
VASRSVVRVDRGMQKRFSFGRIIFRKTRSDKREEFLKTAELHSCAFPRRRLA